MMNPLLKDPNYVFEGSSFYLKDCKYNSTQLTKEAHKQWIHTRCTERNECDTCTSRLKNNLGQPCYGYNKIGELK